MSCFTIRLFAILLAPLSVTVTAHLWPSTLVSKLFGFLRLLPQTVLIRRPRRNNPRTVVADVTSVAHVPNETNPYKTTYF